jgi:large subunit ribosomal protein L17
MSYGRLRRSSDQRKALLRDLVTDLIINDKIVTTEAKAKELKKIFDNMVTLAKQNTLASRRLAAKTVRFEVASVKETKIETKNEKGKIEETTKNVNVYALQKLFDEIGPRYAQRQGGYCRIIKTVPRRGDAAPMAIVEAL